jgi:SMC interacting uncharacterized protein involved in chromosome segregation
MAYGAFLGVAIVAVLGLAISVISLNRANAIRDETETIRAKMSSDMKLEDALSETQSRKRALDRQNQRYLERLKDENAIKEAQGDYQKAIARAKAEANEKLREAEDRDDAAKALREREAWIKKQIENRKSPTE